MKSGKIIELTYAPNFGVIQGLDDDEKVLFRSGAVQGADYVDLTERQMVGYDAVQCDGFLEATIVASKKLMDEVSAAHEESTGRKAKSGTIVRTFKKLEDVGIILRATEPRHEVTTTNRTARGPKDLQTCPINALPG
ncbi:MAG TPA: hypothetical protein EYG03_04600 [Planctomycetes bacterium]|nr:hypothetical protein [Fuerstiella sp.]HIK91258.1 hypothetical protein [Planctomycetota bacterium]